MNTRQMVPDHNILKTLGDIAAASISLTTLFQLLPAIAAVFSIIWTCIRIYDWYEARKQR